MKTSFFFRPLALLGVLTRRTYSMLFFRADESATVVAAAVWRRGRALHALTMD